MDCVNNFFPFRVSISETRKQHLMISALVAKERIDIS